MSATNVWQKLNVSYRAGFTMGPNGAAAPGPHQFHKIRGPHHKDNKIDLFRVVDFLIWQLQVTKAKST